jgi:cephalosporin-C deacetylase-like acetyl esterase
MDMESLSRRNFLYLSLAASASRGIAADATIVDVHQQLLDLAKRQESERRARFAAVTSKADLEALQTALRQQFFALLGGFPAKAGIPPIKKTGQIEADDYVIEKLVYESLPGYFVPALLYKPKKIAGRVPAILSPCGHSQVGKAANAYQILHINLVKRGYVVLTYDPVGQGERSQFWDVAQSKSRFNLGCGEHAVLGNPLYLLGTSLARFRIWDGMRGLDYLESLPEVDAAKIGCVGNSGGGTLTAYIAALDPRVAVAAICCYITTLPRRMGNRIQADPESDPEQDIFGFVSRGIDHAGLLALRAPRPTLLGTARFDFFPIEGAKESFAEAKRLYEVAGAGERIERAEASERHGLSKPLRQACYSWFERWLAGRTEATPVEEITVAPRATRDLLVCKEGQVSRTFGSRPLLPLALEEFRRKPKVAAIPLKELLGLDSNQAAPGITEIAAGVGDAPTTLLCINGNEVSDWRDEHEFLQAVKKQGYAIIVVDPRGVGRSRSALAVKGRDYADPLESVEANIAYNAFLVGKSLLGMRVSDVLSAVRKLAAPATRRRIVLCGRRDAALTALFAAAVEPAIHQVATEELLLSYMQLFAAHGTPINAASILPGMLRDFGDIEDVLTQVSPRKILVAAGVGESARRIPSVQIVKESLTKNLRLLTDWMAGA